MEQQMTVQEFIKHIRKHGATIMRAVNDFERQVQRVDSEIPLEGTPEQAAPQTVKTKTGDGMPMPPMQETDELVLRYDNAVKMAKQSIQDLDVERGKVPAWDGVPCTEFNTTELLRLILHLGYGKEPDPRTKP